MRLSKLAFLAMLVSFLISPRPVLANFSNWEADTNLPYPVASETGFSSYGSLFLLGGSSSQGGSHSEVLNTNTNTSLNWSTISNTLLRLIWHTSTFNGQRVYMLGGFLDSINGTVAYVNNVSFSEVANSNSMGPWNNTTPLPQPLALGASTSTSAFLFHSGGNTIPSQANNPGVAVSNVYVSDINPDGTIGAWRTAGNLPEKTEGHSMIVINNHLVVFGGFTPSGYSNQVIRAPINPDGSIGTWENLTNLPVGMWRFGLARVANTLVIAGDGTQNVYYSEINTDGTIGVWQNGPQLPETNCCGQLIASGNNLYLIGGVANGDYTNHVWKMSYTPDTPPSPTPTPSPSPVPVTSSKVVLIPGTGASWNLDAFISCKKEGYVGNWTLAPYAKDVYADLTTSLENAGWNTIPFYFDWRDKILNNEPKLATFIDSITSDSEKVNIVGHSMGGLLGRAYVENELGGKAKKLLMAGAPNKGSAISYPLYSGHEVWGNDLVDRISKTLFLKHCGVPESIQNLLPTTDYIQKNGSLKPVNTMIAQNNYLPTSFSYPFWDVKVGTLSGSGFPTLEKIRVTNPSKSDVKKGLWLDGKPVGEINTTSGDGAVLVSSAQIDNADNKVINQSHSGLVASTEGISSILEFLGSPGIPDPPYRDPKSALVVVSSSGNFWITDKYGKTYQSEQGMISITNPKDGKYKFRLIADKSKTSVIVAQFLSNGRTLYKEYNLSGFGTKSKTIEFQSKSPMEDCLKDDHRRWSVPHNT